MKTMLLTLLLSTPLLAGEFTAPSEGSGFSADDVGKIVGAVLVAYGGYRCGKGVRVQGEIKQLKDVATRDELETLRRDVYADMGRLTTEIGIIKGYTSEIKGRLDKIDKTQQQILDHVMNP